MVCHVQVEPDRWYYHCDRLGMLVWQDMPSMYWEDPFLCRARLQGAFREAATPARAHPYD